MKIVFLTGAGMSAESGLSTFRGGNGLWDKYPVQQVASHEGWLADPTLVTQFYNERRRQLYDVQPNEGHRLIAQLESKHTVTVITQNVDNLHERAGSTNVIHLHGELDMVCSSRDVEDERYHVRLTPDNCEVKPGTLAGDGSLLRPYIVFFGEAVPKISVASDIVEQADMFVIIGTSLNVYPAAGLLFYAKRDIPIYLIDPEDVATDGSYCITHLRCGASEGMRQLIENLSLTKV